METNSQNIYNDNNVLNNNMNYNNMNYNDINLDTNYYQQNDNNYNFEQNQNYQQNMNNVQNVNYEQIPNYQQNYNYNYNPYGNIISYYNNNPLYAVIPASGPDAAVQPQSNDIYNTSNNYNYNIPASEPFINVQSPNINIEDNNKASIPNVNNDSNNTLNNVVIPASGPYANQPMPKSRGIILRYKKSDICHLRPPECNPGYVGQIIGKPPYAKDPPK